MGLTAQDLGSMAQLSQLAANPQTVPREDLYLAIASLYQTQAPRLSERERGLMREILQRLAGDVEMAVRISLAEKLADDDSAPLDLILLLADDRIEVARPVILRNPQLSDAELLSLLDHAGEDHQAACAERMYIGEPVSEALAQSNSESVLVALIHNVTARIAPHTFATLVEKSRAIAALQDPLVRREDLPGDLATRMCGWVSGTLKSYIKAHHPAAAETAEPKLVEAERGLHIPSPLPKSQPSLSSIKLIDKLAAAGQLRAGFLLRVLHQGQVDLFDVAFAKLLHLELGQFRGAVYQHGPGPVALACRAVGIDRCVFPTVFSLSRLAHGLETTLSPQDKTEIEGIFSAFTKSEALGRLRSFAAGAA